MFGIWCLSNFRQLFSQFTVTSCTSKPQLDAMPEQKPGRKDRRIVQGIEVARYPTKNVVQREARRAISEGMAAAAEAFAL